MKILLCSTLYHPRGLGGAERLVQLLAESLTGAGHHPVVVTLGNGRSPRIAYVRGVPVHTLPIRNIYWPYGKDHHHPVYKALWHGVDSYNPLMGTAFGRIIDQESPAIINTHVIAGFSPAIWRAAKRRGLPIVHTLYDQYLLCPRNSMFKNGRNCLSQCLECRIYSWPRKRSAGLVDVVTGASKFILDRHREHGYFRRAKRLLTRNGYKPPPDTESRVPRVSPTRTLRIGYLGRLQPTKGVDRLVKEFLSLGPGRAHLSVAGTGATAVEATLKALTVGNPDVSWLGFVEAQALLATVDVLVVPSVWHDTAPLVILEAFTHGVPVIGAARGGIPELIPDGTGWLFDPDEPGGLVELFRRCLKEPEKLEVMGAAARRYAERFGASAFVKDYLQAYESALGSRWS